MLPVKSILPAAGCRARRWINGSVVCLLCCAILGGTIGYPSVKQVAKDRSVPFPCQDKPCGCRDAATCWKSCCCNTKKERLAWAKAHGVTPPAFLVAEAKLETTKKKAGACCQVGGKSSPATCTLVTKPKEAKTEFTLVLADSQRKCQGLAPLWTLLSQTILPEWQAPIAEQPAVCGAVATYSESICGLSAPPRLRPPRG
jgi:hypothetical protein